MQEFHYIKNRTDRYRFVVYAQDWEEDRSGIKSYMFICYTQNEQRALLIASALQNYDKTENRKYVFDKTINLS